MRKYFPLVILVATMLFGAEQAVAAVLLDANFDADTVDQLPSEADYFALVDDPLPPDPDRVLVAGPGGIHADPFGPAGNQSMVLNNFDPAPEPFPNSQPQWGFAGIFPDDPAEFTEGTIEFDLFMERPTNPDTWWSYVNVRIGYGDENRTGFASTLGADTTINVSFRQQLGGGCGPPGVCSGLFDDGNGFAGASLVVQPDTATHVEFNIIPPNPADAFPIGKFELRLDGTLVSWGGDPLQTQQPWLTSGFPPAGAPGINTLSFVASAALGLGSDNSTRVWIDNVKVTQVPEPASLLMVILGAGAFAIRPRRRMFA